MSSEPRLLAQGLGKRFALFPNSAGDLVSRFVPLTAPEEHWAVRDVHLDLAAGTCMGIIGHNGSGKSTLLALLAGIQAPSEGTVHSTGRVAALLELGAGFHPDFTGRENARMAAAIHGLSGAVAEARMPSIAEFAGIGAFIDRPVREYSSGMYARLAFAVAAHVDCDILIVDEILGVGDVEFQRRCADFIRSFTSRGIVLLVSHSEETILALCNEALWMANGVVQARGAARDVCLAYHAASQLEASGVETAMARPRAVHTGKVARCEDSVSPMNIDALPVAGTGGSITSADFLNNSIAVATARGGTDLYLRIGYRAPDGTRPALVFALRDRHGTAVVGADTLEFLDGQALPASGHIEFGFLLPFLPTGDYILDVALLDPTSIHQPTCLARSTDAGRLAVLSRHISSGLGSVAQTDAVLLADGEVLPC